MADALEDCVTTFGPDRPAALCRELTKVYETVYRQTLGGLLETVRGDERSRRGESVLVVAGAADAGGARAPSMEQALDLLLEVLPASAAARTVARMYDIERSQAYALAVARSGRDS
jgi:16S rRNA (cytidine1402-2'-O)-methyltransferase